MFSFLLSFTLLAIVSAIGDAEARNSFEEFKLAFPKNYASIGEQERKYQTFKDNLDFIKNFNSTEKGFTVGINEFTDMTNEEFRAVYGRGINITRKPAPLPPSTLKSTSTAPTAWDWRTRGAITPVKNQGQCGSCWSFSATGAIEAAWFIKHNQLISLSEQNLIDCSVTDGNNGCNGGLMEYAFQYVIRNQGVELEATYPYTANGPNYCKFNRSNQGANIQTYKKILSGYEAGLLEATYASPVTAGIDSSPRSFQFYSGGVYNDPSCTSYKLDHAVLVVGYGSDGYGNDYWIVKNSWGPTWGVGGYIMMSRNRQNQCGIATAACYPITLV